MVSAVFDFAFVEVSVFASRYPAFLASSSDMNFATFSFAVELAFLVNFAGEVNPDHSFCFRVRNLFVRGCYGLLASLCTLRIWSLLNLSPEQVEPKKFPVTPAR